MFEIFSNWSISIFFLLTVLKLAFVDIKVKVRKYSTLNLDYFKDYLKETCLLVILQQLLVIICNSRGMVALSTQIVTVLVYLRKLP